MKISELMAGYTPSSTFEGFVTNDDWVLAVDTASTKDSEFGDYKVVQMGIEGLDSQMNPTTMDKQYIRAGQSTTKTGTQRVFSVSGDRYIGDDFQDWAFSHDIKYGTGETVNVPFIYFNVRNGEGEKGMLAVIVNSDAAGNAGDNSTISIDLRKCGAQPTEYTYGDTRYTYTVTTVEPDDWEESYTNYFTRSGSAGSYTYERVTGDSAPEWAASTYYSRDED